MDRREQDWVKNCMSIIQFIKDNGRNPSKHRLEEHPMFNWIKYNRKMLRRDKLSERRRDLFLQLMDLRSKNIHVNQYE